MKKTTRLFSTVILAAMFLVACLALVACNGGNVNNYFVTYDGNKLTVSGKKGEAVDFPEVTRDGYLFDGWYASEDYSGSAIENAVFGEETTYYAKWAEACTITLQPEGGTIKSTSLSVKQGANLLEALADYTPTKGSLQFGGWFDGDNEITSSTVATKGSLTLTARYKAAYTVKAYIEKVDAEDEYEAVEKYAEGYAFVGEGFFPEISMEGFSILSEDEQDKIIDEDSSKNVFEIHFKRNTYKVTAYESYPQGGVAKLISTTEYKYGAEEFLPANKFQYEGYLMLGWTTNRGGTYTDIIGSDYVLNSDITVYPYWEEGYSDMFTGDDYIFLKHDADNTAIILRGGIEIEGTFNTRYQLYEFKNNEDKTIIRAKIDGEHFIYYDTRNASYTFLDPTKGLDENITLSFDETNGLTYYDRTAGERWTGSYEIDGDGIYLASLSNAESGEVKTFAFIVGTYNNTPAFRTRGDEYQYGQMARRNAYYPLMTFDGFGTVTVEISGQSSTYTYAVAKDGVITVVYGQQELTLKIKDYSGTTGYDFYDANLDKVYSLALKGDDVGTTLTLDGCATAVFKSATETFTGTYSYTDSVLYDTLNGSSANRTIVTVVGENKETRVYILYIDTFRDENDEPLYPYAPINMFKQVGTDYTERRLVDNDGNLTDSFLIVEGDGKASTYEYINKALVKTSEGTIDLDAEGYSYTYVTDNVEANAVNFNYASVTVSFSDYNSLSLCFVLNSTDKNGVVVDNTQRYSTKISGANDYLITASVFGIYVPAEGDTFCGLLRDMTSYRVLTDANTAYYLSFDETDHEKFYVLQSAPLVMYKKVDGKTDRTSQLTITWKEISDGKYEAVYTTTDSETEQTTTVNGYYTSQLLVYPGTQAYVYTFTSNDNSVQFKFYLSSSGSYYYFNYFELDTVINFGSYTELKDDDSTDSNNKLNVTDELSNGKLVIVYTVGDVQTKGTFDTYTTTQDGQTVTTVGKEVTAFGDKNYTVVVYTFTSLDGNTVFKFTLNNNYFRICAEDASYTDGNGSNATLQLDGATHIAKYTDADGNESFSYYILTDGVLEENGKAVYMLINESGAYIDIAGNTFKIRGIESGEYNIFKNGVPYGKTIVFDGQGKAVITENGSENKTNATYTISDDLITVSVNGEKLYEGKLGTVSIGGNSYPAYSLLMDNIAGSYINEEDLSVIVLDNAGNAVRYNSYGVSSQGYYFRIDDNLFYFINSASSFAGLYTFNGNKIVNTGTNMTFYSSDFASVVFYSTGSVIINNSETMYYVVDANGNFKTYKAADDVSEAGQNAYGYVVGEIVLNENGTVEYTLNDVTRTYTLSDGTYVTFTDAEHGYTLEFQPSGDPTFTVIGTLTTIPAEGEESKTVKYYVGLDYDDEGNPYVYLADQVSDFVNGSALKYAFTRNYKIAISYNGESNNTFTFTQDDFTMGFYAYNYMYWYYVNYYGSSYASVFNRVSGLLSIICEQTGDNKTFSISGGFNYIQNSEGTAFTFTNGKLYEAGYYSSSFGHAYVAEFTEGEDTYHLTFFLLPPDTASGTYLYRIYTLTKVTNTVVIDEAGNEVYEEELVYTEFNIPNGGKDSEGNSTYYAVGDAFLPTVKYQGKLLGSYPCEKTDDNTWTYYGETFGSNSVESVIRYIFTATYDEETGKLNGGTISKQVRLEVETANGDVVYAWYDGEHTVSEVIGILYKGETTLTEPTTCTKNEGGESFTLTIKGVTYTLEFTFGEDESGAKTVTATLTEKVQETESEEQQAA